VDPQLNLIKGGGGALLRGLDQLLRDETKMSVTIADDPLTCVVRGTGIVVEELESLRDVLLPTDFSRIPK
jgi:rod shape-determining protein MreB